MLLHVPHATKTEKLAKNFGELEVIRQICQSFFTTKVFTVWYHEL